MIKERPILMQTEMVKAVFEGRKTQTRRIIKPQPEINGEWLTWSHKKCFTQTTVDDFGKDPLNAVLDCCPYGKVGDVLWVRETWAHEYGGGILYRASHSHMTPDGNWKPSLFMPKEATRIWLEITDVKVERVQDISVNDALAEGIDYKSKYPVSYKAASNVLDKFRDLWNRINAATENGDYAWSANPFVWALSFKVLSTKGKPALAAHCA